LKILKEFKMLTNLKEQSGKVVVLPAPVGPLQAQHSGGTYRIVWSQHGFLAHFNA
jgi:hypothetical protein